MSSQKQKEEEPGTEAAQQAPPKKQPINTFKFEVGCDHSPDFKTAYEMIFKSNLLYTDENGHGQSFPSMIKGGLAGDGHNNIVTASCDLTYQAMTMANNMQKRNMTKVSNNLPNDTKCQMLKPSLSIFYGQRHWYDLEEE